MTFDPALRQRLLLPDYPAAQTGELTVAAWVFAHDASPFGTVAKNWSDAKRGQFYMGLWDGEDNLAAQIQQPDGTVVRAEEYEPFPLGRWTHVACVVNDSTLRLYRDGAQVAWTSCRGLITTPAMKSMGIGYKAGDDGISPSNGRSGYWDGRMDELAVFHRALSTEEINEMYNAGKID